MVQPVRVGVVGCGYWGPNLIRNFQRQADAQVVAVADQRPERLEPILRASPGLEGHADAAALIARADIDAVVIATPVATHFPLALAALQAGKHVFVEKPLADSEAACARLIEEAERRKLVLMVDHVFVFTSAVQKIEAMLARGDLGELYYYDSVRVNLGLFQPDVNVIWDLAVHDLAILDAIAPGPPLTVAATAHRHIPGQAENMAALTLSYAGNFTAHINVNWLSPVKVRRTLIGGSKRMIVYDDIEPDHKIMVYEKGVDYVDPGPDAAKVRVSYRTGDMAAPHLDGREALDRAAAHFLECVRSGEAPRTDGRAGLRVVAVMAAAMRSLAAGGTAMGINA